MAVKKRGKKWHFKIRVFGKEVGVATDARLKSGAEEIERSCKDVLVVPEITVLWTPTRGKSASGCSGIRDGSFRQVLSSNRELGKS